MELSLKVLVKERKKEDKHGFLVWSMSDLLCWFLAILLNIILYNSMIDIYFSYNSIYADKHGHVVDGVPFLNQCSGWRCHREFLFSSKKRERRRGAWVPCLVNE